MSDVKWEKFFDTLVTLINEEKPWREKKKEFKEQADAYGDDAMEAVKEAFGWFHEE